MKKIIVAVLVLLTLVIPAKPTEAAWVTKSVSHHYYSIVGLNVGGVTFYAEGESSATSGSVSNMWITDWTWWPNYIKDKSTWKSYYPKGQRANAQYTIGAGINTQWFEAAITTQTSYMTVVL